MSQSKMRKICGEVGSPRPKTKLMTKSERRMAALQYVANLNVALASWRELVDDWRTEFRKYFPEIGSSTTALEMLDVLISRAKAAKKEDLPPSIKLEDAIWHDHPTLKRLKEDREWLLEAHRLTLLLKRRCDGRDPFNANELHDLLYILDTLADNVAYSHLPSLMGWITKEITREEWCERYSIPKNC